ncbi:hypothetical protein CEXT_536951 [Caerostris extrusa]|uniref:Uncharacterized protein n=1 Tax=Caerostris extrusa TaxID=172846 RepID=A0AAV4P3L8_CAEEX|nr:hypothetical protein CEXT_536951 [Caerostris extrusa]
MLIRSAAYTKTRRRNVLALLLKFQLPFQTSMRQRVKCDRTPFGCHLFLLAFLQCTSFSHVGLRIELPRLSPLSQSISFISLFAATYMTAPYLSLGMSGPPKRYLKGHRVERTVLFGPVMDGRGGRTSTGRPFR